MSYGSKLQIPPTNYHLLAAEQEPTKNVSEIFGEKSGEWTISRKMTRQKEKDEKRDRQEESNDSPEIPDCLEHQISPGKDLNQ